MKRSPSSGPRCIRGGSGADASPVADGLSSNGAEMDIHTNLAKVRCGSTSDPPSYRRKNAAEPVYRIS
jgi:hypothetical protein